MPNRRPQALDDGQQRGDVGGIAGPEERGDRPVVAIEHDAQHHLMQLWPEVLGEAALAEGRSAPALEVQRGGVEEGDR